MKILHHLYVIQILLVGFTVSIGAFVVNAPVCSNNFFHSCKTTKLDRHFSNKGLNNSNQNRELSMTDIRNKFSSSLSSSSDSTSEDTKSASNGESYTAYLVNVSYETTHNELHDLFSQYGTVEKVFIPTNRKNGRPKGIAFVSMSTAEELDTVLDKLSGTEIYGRTVYLNKAKPKGQRDELTKLFVGNMSRDTSTEELVEYFSQWGKVKDCYMPRDRYTNSARGFGFVSMSLEDATKAIENANGADFGGRKIEVDISMPNGKNDKKTSDTVKLYVGNLSYYTDDQTLREAFEYAGPVIDVYMPLDRDTGDRRGFAFVTVSAEQAESSIMELHGYELDGRALRVNEARKFGAEVDNNQSKNYDDNSSYGEEESVSYDEGGQPEQEDIQSVNTHEETEVEINTDEVEAARIASEEAEASRIAETKEAKIAAEEEAARIATEEAEAVKIAAEEVAARIVAEEVEAAKIAAEEEALRIAAEEAEASSIAEAKAARIAEAEMAKLAAEEAEAAKIAAEEEAARIAAEEEAARIAAEEAEAARIAVESEQKQRSLLEAQLEMDVAAKIAAEKTKEAERSRITDELRVSQEALEQKQRSLLKGQLEMEAAAKIAAEEAEEEEKSRITAELRVAQEMSERRQRSLLKDQLEMEAAVRAKIKAKEAAEAAELATREAKIQAYGAMGLEDRAFNILYDLGLVEITPDPESPDYDSKLDNELVPDQIFLDEAI